jgi:hypothetical protein
MDSINHLTLDALVGRGYLSVGLRVLTAIVFDGLEGRIRTYAPEILAFLIANIECGKTAAERDVDAVLVKIFRRAVTKMSDIADVTQIVEKDVVPSLAGFRLIKVEGAFFCVKIVLHCLLILSGIQKKRFFSLI